VHSKLIAIMGDRLTAHCKSLHTINWDEPPAPNSSGPNSYMELLIKETLTLHKVLSKYLASQAVELVISQVFADINHRLSEEYGKIDLPNQEAKERLLQDARYLHQKLSGLKDIGAPSAMLETVVKEKPVPLRRSPFNRRISVIPTAALAAPTPVTATTTSEGAPTTEPTSTAPAVPEKSSSGFKEFRAPEEGDDDPHGPRTPDKDNNNVDLNVPGPEGGQEALRAETLIEANAAGGGQRQMAT